MSKLKEDEEVCSFCREILPQKEMTREVVAEDQSGFQFLSSPIYGWVCKKCKKEKNINLLEE